MMSIEYLKTLVKILFYLHEKVFEKICKSKQGRRNESTLATHNQGQDVCELTWN